MQAERNKAVFDRLYQVAADQQGYFTTKQAKAAGYADSVHPFHVKMGNWIREERGIYRLAKFPLGEHSDMMLWYLWSRDRSDKPQGVYSHETVLSFHELSDINPAKLHMTVPPSFRRRGEIPKILVLHRRELGKEDVQEIQGFKMTTPLKAIVDVLAARTIQMDHVEQAVKQAFTRGLITSRQLEDAPSVPSGFKKEIERLRNAPMH